MTTVLIFLAVLGVLILVHEVGHFVVARLAGIRVDEFSIFMGPKLLGWRRNNIDYSLRAIPLGGYVKIYGEDPTEEHYADTPSTEASFVQKPRYIQAAVLVAGVAMNVLLAYVIYLAVFLTGMPTALDADDPAVPLSEAQILVTDTLKDAPAVGQLLPNDEIVRVRTESFVLEVKGAPSMSDIIDTVARSNGQPVTFDVLRTGQATSVTLTPAKGIVADEPDRYAAGFTMQLVGFVELPLVEAIPAAFTHTILVTKETAMGLGAFFASAFKGEADISQVSGPIGIVEYVGDAARLGTTWLLLFTAVISINLAIINLLPIPALDGGRLLFVGIEAITRRPLKPAIANTANQIGFVLLLLLLFVVSVSDVLKYFR